MVFGTSSGRAVSTFKVNIKQTEVSNSKLQVADKFYAYEYTPERVTNANSTSTVWDVTAITNRSAPANRPDTVLHDKKKREDLPTDRYSHT